jgi:hypothetical protein
LARSWSAAYEAKPSAEGNSSLLVMADISEDCLTAGRRSNAGNRRVVNKFGNHQGSLFK